MGPGNRINAVNLDEGSIVEHAKALCDVCGTEFESYTGLTLVEV